MKKFMSILLACIMVVVSFAETAVFALPAAVETMETVEEIFFDEAALADESDADLAAEVTYTVSFNANGGTGSILSQKKNSGRPLCIKNEVPEREGYTFAGWSTSSTAEKGEYIPGGYYTKDESVTLYAVWTDEFFGLPSYGAKYQVVATPYYHLDWYEPTFDFGYDCLQLEMIESGDYSPLPWSVYLTAEDLGIDEDCLDDYFLGEFSVLAVYDEYYEDIHTVLAAQCNMTKKTVTDLELGTVATENEDSYFWDYEGITDCKLLSGKLVVDGSRDTYVFDAPYSYLKPTYPVDANAYDKYMIRNANNLLAVGFYKDYSFEGAKSVMSAYFDEIVRTPNEDEVADSYFVEQAYQLAACFRNVFYGGLYEADLYDFQGDGIYDAIDYKPYFVFRADDDEDYYFEDSDFDGYYDGIPYIYTNGTTVIGEEFNDGDLVIGYYSYDTEVVKIAEVVPAVTQTLDGFRKTTGTITLGNGDVVDVTSGYQLVQNLPIYSGEIAFDHDKEFGYQVESHADLMDSANVGEQFNFYIYNGVLLAYEEIDNSLKYDGTLLIPTDFEYSYQIKDEWYDTYDNEDVLRYPVESFDDEYGKIWYIYAWVDGKTKYIPVVTEDVEPRLIWDYTLSYEYKDKLCTYTIGEDGVYTIRSLAYDVDDSDPWIYEGINRDGLEGEYDNGYEYAGYKVLDDGYDDSLQFYAYSDEAEITKVAGSRHSLSCFDRALDFNSNTKIVIRVYDVKEESFQYAVYSSSDFTARGDETVFTNVSFVVENNPYSVSREKLLVFYGETTDTSYLKATEVVTPEYTFNYPENVIIPTDLYYDYEYDGEWHDTDLLARFPEEAFEPDFGKTWYVYAWVDGVQKYVPVVTEDISPSIIKYGELRYQYLNKICLYTIDEYGRYVIKSLGYDVEDDDSSMYDGINRDGLYDYDNESEFPGYSVLDDKRDSSLRYYIDGLEGEFTKITTNRYSFSGFDRDLVLSPETKIIIRVFDREEDEFVYSEFSSEDFEASDSGIPLTNVSFIVKNDVSSTVKENLEIFYAETTDTSYIKGSTTEKPVYTFDFPENVIIPTTDYNEPVQAFNKELGTAVWYVYAYADGEVKYVPVNNNACDIPVISYGYISDYYNNEICTYTIDENGLYVLKSLRYDVDEYGDITDANSKFEVLDNNIDESLLFYGQTDGCGVEMIGEKKFVISGFERAVELNDETKIVIRYYNYDRECYEYVLFDETNFNKSISKESWFNDCKFIVSNNPDSRECEDLVVLYIDVDYLEFEAFIEENSERIVSDVTIGQDEDGYWRLYYDLFNPYTGVKEYNVPSQQYAVKASELDYYCFNNGDIITLVDGMVPDSEKLYYGNARDRELVLITEVDMDEEYFVAANYNEITGYSYGCRKCINQMIDDGVGHESNYDFIYGDHICNGYGEPTSFIAFDENTVVSVIKNNNVNSIWMYGSMSLSSMSKIASPTKSLLCWNDKVEDRYGNYSTGYSEYVKAYVSVDYDSLEDGEMPKAKFVIVVVNGDDSAALNSGCDIHSPDIGAQPVLEGDLNLDGTVDVNDAVLLLQHSMFPDLYTLPEGFDFPDYNNDGTVDIRDAILLLQHSMFPDLYPLE